MRVHSHVLEVVTRDVAYILYVSTGAPKLQMGRRVEEVENNICSARTAILRTPTSGGCPRRLKGSVANAKLPV